MTKSTIKEAIINSAKRYDVSPEIHSKDFIFQFVINHPCFTSPELAVDYYFQDGQKSCAKLLSLIKEIMSESETRIRLLEFASGYGCVTRHLAKHSGILETTACDIHKSATDFIRSKFKVQVIQSEPIPEDLHIQDEFNVVFALSFFSHMPHHTWSRWLNKLYELTAAGGCLIFTTHGLESKIHLGYPVIPDNGFWFSPQSEQKDLDTSDYGSTIVTLDFVSDTVKKNLVDPIWLYRYAYWWEHQDLYVIRKYEKADFK
jgi:SAM-dependent methyltransferase